MATFGTTSSGATVGGLTQIIGITYSLPENGTVSLLSVYSPASGGTVVGAIYSDLAGVPYQLLTKNEVGVTVLAAQFTDITLPPTYLPAGTYWLTAMSSANSLRAFNAGPGGNKVAYNLGLIYGTSFPQYFPTPTYSTEDYPCYATYIAGGGQGDSLNRHILVGDGMSRSEVAN